MSINNELDLKTRFVWARILESLAKLFNILGLREKETYNSKWNIYFGVMFFEVQGRIFFASDNVQGTFVDFRFMMLTKVLMKQLARILIHVHKIFKRKGVLQNTAVNVSQLLRIYFNIAVISNFRNRTF